MIRRFVYLYRCHLFCFRPLILADDSRSDIILAKQVLDSGYVASIGQNEGVIVKASDELIL